MKTIDFEKSFVSVNMVEYFIKTMKESHCDSLMIEMVIKLYVNDLRYIWRKRNCLI